MSENTRRPLTTKVHLYQALYLFNRGFDITLAGLKRLEELGVFRNENLSDYEVMLELTRSEANDELTTVMQGYEEDDAAFWDDRYRERQKRLADPDAFSLRRATANRKSRNRSRSFRLASPASIQNGDILKSKNVPDAQKGWRPSPPAHL